MHCAIYARYSTEHQRETSIDDQVAKATEYAEQRGWQVLPQHIYTDAKVSGASLDDRPGMCALRTAAESKPKPFDTLLTEDSSRVSRNVGDFARFRERMRFVDINVIFIGQHIETNDEQSETLLNVHSWMDSHGREEAGRRSLRGRHGQMSRGYATGGRTFGYTSTPVPGSPGGPEKNGVPLPLGWKIAVNPEEATTIRRIFEMYASGMGFGRIADELNQSGVGGPRGHRWVYNAVRRVLHNERYLGQQILGQRKFLRRPETRQKVARPQPRETWRIRERPDLRIVPDELWARVHGRLGGVSASLRRQADSNLLRGRNVNAHSRHLFTGVMRCGVCGGAMSIVTGGCGSPRYGCRQSWRNGRSACSNRLTIQAKVADPVLLSGLQERLTEPATVSYLTEAVSGQVAAILNGRPQRRQFLESERTQAERRLKNLVAALEDEGPSPTVRQAIRDREAELARIEHELAVEPLEPQERLTVVPTWIAGRVADVVELLQEAPEQAKTGLGRLGLSFIVSPIHDAQRPFLRAVGAANLLAGMFAKEFALPASGRSHRESGRGKARRPRGRSGAEVQPSRRLVRRGR
jgi:site-specific DNA recombinase